MSDHLILSLSGRNQIRPALTMIAKFRAEQRRRSHQDLILALSALVKTQCPRIDAYNQRIASSLPIRKSTAIPPVTLSPKTTIGHDQHEQHSTPPPYQMAFLTDSQPRHLRPL